MADDNTQVEQKADAGISLAEFLQTVPPNSGRRVTDLVSRVHPNGTADLNAPALLLHCDDEVCQGQRVFRLVGYVENFRDRTDAFVTYGCSNCGRHTKVFALRAVKDPTSRAGSVMKFGEVPTFGPPIPSRVISLIGGERDAYLKGRQCEDQGLGIGAFAYYRRVVENQKNKLLDQIIKVAERTSADAEVLRTLEAAKRETQFKKAVEMVKDAIPSSLRMDGHNPMTLLHSALSEGLHAKTDEDCLELATSIRAVLEAFSERVATVLRDDAGLKSALSRLMNPTQATSA